MLDLPVDIIEKIILSSDMIISTYNTIITLVKTLLSNYDKITQHKTRIKQRYNYSKSSLEQGMIVEMTYKRRVKKGDPTRLETKKYMVVVLNPVYKGYLHAISLENVSSVQLNNLGNDWGLDNVSKGSAIITKGILTGLKIPKIQMVGSSGRFYFSSYAYKWIPSIFLATSDAATSLLVKAVMPVFYS